MGFNEDIKSFSERISSIKDNITTEEATKMSLVVPFFHLMGYDVFSPSEFCAEYSADVGIKRGEKVDYAIIINGNPEILIECKWCGEVLDKHNSQLFRYFGTTSAKFGILTNGIIYRFYTDLDQENVMDLTPFLEVDMLNLKDAHINELKKFTKENFDKDSIFSTASELKYSNLIKDYFKGQFDSPDDEFVRFVLGYVYDGQKNQKVIDKFKPIVKKSFTTFINDIVNDKISSALKSNTSDTEDMAAVTDPEPEAQPVSKIETTEEELESFYIIRAILSETVNVSDVVHKDTESYFGVLYQGNTRKPICRLKLGAKVKHLLIPDDNKDFTKYTLEASSDIYKYRKELIESASRYIK